MNNPNTTEFVNVLSKLYKLDGHLKTCLLSMTQVCDNDNCFKTNELYSYIKINNKMANGIFKNCVSMLKKQLLILPVSRGEYMLNKQMFGDGIIKTCKSATIQVRVINGVSKLLLKFD